MKQTHLKPSFVEFIPDHLEDGVLYISERFRTCSHNCCCGCGEEVVLPLSPAEWQLSRDGDVVSLWPSVGNWNYACQSHYVIRSNRVLWASSMTDHQIKRVKQRDEAALRAQVRSDNAARDREKLEAANAVAAASPTGKADIPHSGAPRRQSLWERFLSMLGIGQDA